MTNAGGAKEFNLVVSAAQRLVTVVQAQFPAEDRRAAALRNLIEKLSGEHVIEASQRFERSTQTLISALWALTDHPEVARAIESSSTAAPTWRHFTQNLQHAAQITDKLFISLMHGASLMGINRAGAEQADAGATEIIKQFETHAPFVPIWAARPDNHTLPVASRMILMQSAAFVHPDVTNRLLDNSTIAAAFSIAVNSPTSQIRFPYEPRGQRGPSLDNQMNELVKWIRELDADEYEKQSSHALDLFGAAVTVVTRSLTDDESKQEEDHSLFEDIIGHFRKHPGALSEWYTQHHHQRSAIAALALLAHKAELKGDKFFMDKLFDEADAHELGVVSLAASSELRIFTARNAKAFGTLLD